MSEAPPAREKLKPTTNIRQAWLTLAIAIALGLFFGLVLLPHYGRRATLEGSPAPDFNLEVIAGGPEGNRVHLASLQGKAVVLDFWASWCAPCRQQAPIVEELARAHASGSDLMVVGVNTSDEKDDAITYVRGQNLGYTMVFDEGSRVANAYQVHELPTLIVIGKNGKIHAIRARVVRKDELEELVREASRG